MSDVTIHGISVNGEGVGRLPDGRVVFVDSALPGDVVRINLTESRKRVLYADLVQVVEPSSDRVGSRCPVERCGGCVLRAVSPEGQARLKRQTVLEALRRIGGFDASEIMAPVAQFGDGWANRHRVRLHATHLDGRWQLGYFERRSRRLVPLAACPVIWPELERMALALARALADFPRQAEIESVELAYSRRDGRGGARIVAQGAMAAFRQSLDWIAKSELAGVEVQAGDGRWRHGNLELRYDHKHADEYDLRFEPGLFTQAFPEGNDALVEAVLGHIKPRSNPRVLELHAGIGNFSVPLARAGAHVIAYERSKRAAVMCQRNGRAPGLHLTVHAADDTEAVGLFDQSDVVLIDPPRTGARAVMEALAAQPAPRVVYVSCDPATLARDAAILQRGGYLITAVQAFDMFPETPHVETLCVFDRA